MWIASNPTKKEYHSASRAVGKQLRSALLHMMPSVCNYRDSTHVAFIERRFFDFTERSAAAITKIDSVLDISLSFRLI